MNSVEMSVAGVVCALCNRCGEGSTDTAVSPLGGCVEFVGLGSAALFGLGSLCMSFAAAVVGGNSARWLVMALP